VVPSEQQLAWAARGGGSYFGRKSVTDIKNNKKIIVYFLNLIPLNSN
jgi:hypothetical protein